MNGWFADPSDMDQFDEFFEQQGEEARGRRIRMSWQDEDRVYYISRIALFGIAGNTNVQRSMDRCQAICGKSWSRECPVPANDFCKIDKKNGRHNSTDFYRLRESMIEYLESRSINIISIIGEHRYNAFVEFLTDGAIARYDKYTRREIKENNLVRPGEFDAGFVSLDEIQEDPWEKFKAKQIQQGDLGCLHFSDSLFSA